MPDDATPADLAATAFIDADAPAVRAFAAEAAAGAADEHEAASRLFAAVRDGIRYDPYRLPTDAPSYSGTAVLEAGTAYCVPKSVLLAAGARSLGIPARLGFADVRNHLQSDRLREGMGTDRFVWHGYALLHLGGAWRKASPAFNRELCARFGVEPLDFDGRSDALMHAFDGAGDRYMEYLEDHGSFADLPFERLMTVYAETYPGLAWGDAGAEVAG